MTAEVFAAASIKCCYAVASAISVFAVGVGDVGMGVLGITVLTATAIINIYSKFRDEQRNQMRKDLEAAKDTWKWKYENLNEQYLSCQHLIETLKQEIRILQGRQRRRGGERSDNAPDHRDD